MSCEISARRLLATWTLLQAVLMHSYGRALPGRQGLTRLSTLPLTGGSQGEM
jgi:hypothetical protein